VIEEADFWRQIADAPNDPAIREVYADWLLMRGERRRAHALQYAARSGLPLDPIVGPWAHFTEAQRKKIRVAPQNSGWMKVLRALGPIEDVDLWGGLPSLITYDAREVIHAESLIAMTRFARTRIRFSSSAWSAADIAASGVLRHVRALVLDTSYQEIDPEESGVALRSVEVGDHVLTALCGSASVASLEVLVVYSGGVTAVGARALAKGAFAGLRWLQLQSNPLGAEGGVALGASPILRTVERLDLSGCRLGAEGAWAIVRSPQLSKLVTLDLRDNHLGDVDRAALREALHERPGLRSFLLDTPEPEVVRGSPNVPPSV
jgi:uncharacterized protein (TIGR02996 family)